MPHFLANKGDLRIVRVVRFQNLPLFGVCSVETFEGKNKLTIPPTYTIFHWLIFLKRSDKYHCGRENENTITDHSHNRWHKKLPVFSITCVNYAKISPTVRHQGSHKNIMILHDRQDGSGGETIILFRNAKPCDHNKTKHLTWPTIMSVGAKRRS